MCFKFYIRYYIPKWTQLGIKLDSNQSIDGNKYSVKVESN